MITAATARLSKKAFAALFGLTTRQISNLIDDGLPREVEGNRVYIPVPIGPRWYVEWKAGKLTLPAGDEEKKTLTTRRLEVELRLAELELAKAEGAVVTLDYMEAQLEGAAQRLRAKHLNIPGKYAPAMVGLRSVAESQARLEGMISETLAALAETGEDPELDDDGSADA